MSRLAVSLAFLLLLTRGGSGQDRPVQGDVNGDGKRNVADAVYLLRHIFGDGPAPVDVPCAACDSCCPEISRLLKTGSRLSMDYRSGWATTERPVDTLCTEDGCSQAGASRHYELATFGSKNPADWITVDYATGLMWQTQCRDERFESLNEALAYCRDLTLGPFDDWRLPGINELLTLVIISEFGYFDKWLCGRQVYETRIVMDRDFFRWRYWPHYAGVNAYWSFVWQRGFCQVLFDSSCFYTCSCFPSWSGYGRAVRQILPGDLTLLGLPEKPSGFRREAPRNGDVDGDGARDADDVIYLLAYLFTGGPAPVPNDCPACDSCCPEFPARPLQTGAGGATEPGVPRSFEILRFGSDNPREWVTVDHATGLMWQYAYEDVMTYVEAASLARVFSSRGLGGFGDWRIPNIFEIMSLAGYNPDAPHDYRGFFEFPPVRDFSFLSSTLDVSGPRLIGDCDCGFNVSDAYGFFSSWTLKLAWSHFLWGSDSTYLRFVRTIQPGDLVR